MDPRHDKQHPFGAVERLDLEFKRATDRLPSSFFETAYAPGAGRPVFEDGDMFTVTVPLAATAAKTAPEVGAQVTGEVTGEVLRLLAACEGVLTRQELQSRVGIRHDEHFRLAYIVPALAAGLVEMTIPDKPRSRLQKYRLTDKGRATLLKGKES
ncbi:MAG: hypothetical protein JXA69_06445 [Phycisphaerae bacterium]|nr:hypothetical protein [Phycisphaerae bacterium]